MNSFLPVGFEMGCFSLRFVVVRVTSVRVFKTLTLWTDYLGTEAGKWGRRLFWPTLLILRTTLGERGDSTPGRNQSHQSFKEHLRSSGLCSEMCPPLPTAVGRWRSVAPLGPFRKKHLWDGMGERKVVHKVFLIPSIWSKLKHVIAMDSTKSLGAGLASADLHSQCLAEFGSWGFSHDMSC